MQVWPKPIAAMEEEEALLSAHSLSPTHSPTQSLTHFHSHSHSLTHTHSLTHPVSLSLSLSHTLTHSQVWPKPIAAMDEEALLSERRAAFALAQIEDVV